MEEFSIEYKGKDFNANKPRQYEEVRKLMVKLNEDYCDIFDPVEIPLIHSEVTDEDAIQLVKGERKIANENIKHGKRQGFSNAVLT